MKRQKEGKIFILEGIDEVGKTTLVSEISRYLKKEKINCSTYCFPGNSDRTLGKLVYDIHHNQDKYVDDIEPLSLQMLHVAAHIDIIKRKIIPDLRKGKNIILDRCWWSTLAYGITNKVDKKKLEKLIELETELIDEKYIGHYFYIERKSANKSQQDEILLKSYDKIILKNQYKGVVSRVNNDRKLQNAIDEIVEKIKSIVKEVEDTNEQLTLKEYQDTNILVHNEENMKNIYINREPFKVTPVYRAYWEFAVKRQEIFFHRLKQEKIPWTDDMILQKYKFTNAYRASDRVSQYLIKNIIYNGRQYTNEDTLFRIILFKLFNKIETWEYLENELGDINFKEYDYNRYSEIIERASNDGPVYSAAYIMPSGKSSFGFDKKYQNNLKLLEKMMADKLALKIAKVKNLEGLYRLLLEYPTLGKFLAFQFSIDINYSELCDFNEMSFVVAGPGAISGINKCFIDIRGYSEQEIIKFMADNQEEEFEKLGLKFKDLWGRKLQLIDCQNLFCETDKYSRVAFPTIQGKSERTKIKQIFMPKIEPIEYFYPPKWGINDRVKKDLGALKKEF